MGASEQRVVPALRITDHARSRAFYVDGLGFRVEWEHRFGPTFPVFMAVSRDGMELFLSEHAGDCQVGGLVHFRVPDVDADHEEFRRRGVAAHEAPNEDLEGLRVMTVVDPDGNRLRFITRLDQAGSEVDGRQPPGCRGVTSASARRRGRTSWMVRGGGTSVGRHFILPSPPRGGGFVRRRRTDTGFSPWRQRNDDTSRVVAPASR